MCPKLLHQKRFDDLEVDIFLNVVYITFLHCQGDFFVDQ